MLRRFESELFYLHSDRAVNGRRTHHSCHGRRLVSACSPECVFTDSWIEAAVADLCSAQLRYASAKCRKEPTGCQAYREEQDYPVYGRRLGIRGGASDN